MTSTSWWLTAPRDGFTATAGKRTFKDLRPSPHLKDLGGWSQKAKPKAAHVDDVEV